MRSLLATRLFATFASLALLAACQPAGLPAQTPTPPTAVQPSLPLPPVASQTPNQAASPAASILLPDTLAWSPDSRWLAYSDIEGSIWLHSPNLEQPARLAEPAVAGADLAWLPDGSLLVWDRSVLSSNLEAVRPIRLYRLVLAGSEIRELAQIEVDLPAGGRDQNQPIEFVPAPDGDRLAFTAGGDAHLLSLEQQSSEQLTRLKENPLEPAGDPPFDTARSLLWSPDGSRLAVGLTGSECPSPCSGTALLDLVSGDIRLLAARTHPLGWAPGGESVLAVNTTGDWTQGYTYDCYRLPVEGGPAENLTRSNPDYDQLLDPPEAYVDADYQVQSCRWDADGALIALAADYSGLANDLPYPGFIAVDPAGERQAYLPDGEYAYSTPYWLAGGRLLFTRIQPGEPGSLEVYAGEQRIDALTAGAMSTIPFGSALSPDQRWLALVTAVNQSPVLLEIP